MTLKPEDLLNNFQKQVDSFTEFLSLIPWTEHWLISIMVFHLFSLACVFLTRNHHNVQYILFFVLLVLVYLTETINTYAAENWRLFAKENYFDSNGLFISTVFSTPVLFNCIMFIIMWLTAASRSVIWLKQQELTRQAKREKKLAEKNGEKVEEKEEEEEEEETEEEEVEDKKTK